jgi:hypothetical protein
MSHARKRNVVTVTRRDTYAACHSEDTTMARRPITAIHKNDPGWIIALWLAIHGGDPAPEHIGQAEVSRAATAIIRELAQHLDAAHAKAVTAALGH